MHHRKNYRRRCQLLYSIRKASIDISTFIPQNFRGKEVNPFVQMDHGMLDKLGVQHANLKSQIPQKLEICIRQLLEEESFESYIICTFHSSPPEWIDLRIEPAKHAIKLEAKECVHKPTTIEESLSLDPDEDWQGLHPIGEQVKHWRASIQGSS